MRRLVGQFAQLLTANLRSIGKREDSIFQTGIHQIAIQRALVLQIDFGLASLGAEQRRLRNIEIALLDQRPHMAEEESQQKRPDV